MPRKSGGKLHHENEPKSGGKPPEKRLSRSNSELTELTDALAVGDGDDDNEKGHPKSASKDKPGRKIYRDSDALEVHAVRV